MEQQLKFAGRFALGDVIRAHDFAGNQHCYMEGIIRRTDHALEGGVRVYVIQITERVWSGVICPDEVDTLAYVPHQLAIGDYDGRVVLVLSASERALITEFQRRIAPVTQKGN